MFIFDILGLTTLVYIYLFPTRHDLWYDFILVFIYFFKIFPVLTHVTTLEKLLINQGASSVIYEFGKLLVQISIICHFVAIFYHVIAKYEYDEKLYEQNWYEQFGLQDTTWENRYLNSFFWALSTMMLIGSAPNNQVEVGYTIFVILFTVGIFAYTINEIGILMEQVRQNDKQLKEELFVINQYMKDKNTSLLLQQKVRSYLEFSNSNLRNIENKDKVKGVIEKLPFDLRDIVTKELNQNLLLEFPVLQKNFSKITLNHLLKNMTEKLYIKGETIFNKDQYAEISIYLIIRGSVDLYQVREFEDEDKHLPDYHQSKIVKIKQMNKGDVFGTTGNYHEFIARCSQTCTVYQITKENIEQCLKKHPEDYEKYQMVKDTLLYPRDIKRNINQHCMICNKYTHPESQCTLVHYQPTLMCMLKQLRSKNVIKRYKQFSRNSSQITDITSQDLSVFSDSKEYESQSIYQQEEIQSQQQSENINSSNFSSEIDGMDKKKQKNKQSGDKSISNSSSSNSSNLSYLDSQVYFLDKIPEIDNYFTNKNPHGFIKQNISIQKVKSLNLKSMKRLHYLAMKLQDLNRESVSKYVDRKQYKKWMASFQRMNSIKDEYYKDSENINFYWVWLSEYLIQQNVINQDIEDFEIDSDEENFIKSEQDIINKNQNYQEQDDVKQIDNFLKQQKNIYKSGRDSRRGSILNAVSSRRPSMLNQQNTSVKFQKMNRSNNNPFQSNIVIKEKLKDEDDEVQRLKQLYKTSKSAINTNQKLKQTNSITISRKQSKSNSTNYVGQINQDIKEQPHRLNFKQKSDIYPSQELSSISEGISPQNKKQQQQKINTKTNLGDVVLNQDKNQSMNFEELEIMTPLNIKKYSEKEQDFKTLGNINQNNQQYQKDNSSDIFSLKDKETIQQYKISEPDNTIKTQNNTRYYSASKNSKNNSLINDSNYSKRSYSNNGQNKKMKQNLKSPLKISEIQEQSLNNMTQSGELSMNISQNVRKPVDKLKSAIFKANLIKNLIQNKNDKNDFDFGPSQFTIPWDENEIFFFEFDKQKNFTIYHKHLNQKDQYRKYKKIQQMKRRKSKNPFRISIQKKFVYQKAIQIQDTEK